MINSSILVTFLQKKEESEFRNARALDITTDGKYVVGGLKLMSIT